MIRLSMNSTVAVSLLLIGGTGAVAESKTGLRQKAVDDSSPSPSFPLEFDQTVAHHSPELLFGHDNLNGGFTTNRQNNIEIGLRTKLQYPYIENEYNSNGDGTYSWKPADCFGEPSNCKIPHWSMEFSIATLSEGSHIGDYCWELGMDADPSDRTDFTTFDPVSQSYEAAFFDHAFGDLNRHEEGGNSIYKLGNDCTESISSAQMCQRYYTQLLANYNVAQNYWNYGFASLPGTSLYYFDRGVSGNYVVYLRALDCTTHQVLASSHIQVLVGDAPKLSSVSLPEATQVAHGGRTVDCPLNSNLEFSQDLSRVLMSNNNNNNALVNGGFTTDRRNGLEIALRTRQNHLQVAHELPSSNVFHDNADGIYWWQRSECDNNIVPCTSSTPQWNIDFSMQTSNAKSLGDYCWEMGIDTDPSDNTEFVTLDPMNPSDTFPLFNHSFSSGSDVVIKNINDGTCTDPKSCKDYYTSLVKKNTLAQNSWNLGEMLSSVIDFDFTKDGSYVIYIRAKECTNSKFGSSPTILAESFLQVLVGSKYPVWNVQLPTPTKRKANMIPTSAVI
jgi:hypothetical protein